MASTFGTWAHNADVFVLALERSHLGISHIPVEDAKVWLVEHLEDCPVGWSSIEWAEEQALQLLKEGRINGAVALAEYLNTKALAAAEAWHRYHGAP